MAVHSILQVELSAKPGSDLNHANGENREIEEWKATGRSVGDTGRVVRRKSNVSSCLMNGLSEKK